MAPALFGAHTLTYGTYLGGSGADFVGAMAVDAAGDVYLAGWTESLNFPGGSIRARQGGVEAFVVKVNLSQNRVVWATYLGGSGDDRALALAVDSAGSVRVAGFTTSIDFPAVNAMQPHSGGGAREAFIARLDASGVVMFSTYLGGSGVETAHALALTSNGSTWVAGETNSTNFPTASARQGTNAGLSDAFVTLIGPTGTLISSSYLGAAADDRATALSVDSTGAVYVGGTTKSPLFPTLSGVQMSHGGGQDAFVTKLNAAGSSIIYSTFLGGADRETAGLPETVTDIVAVSDGSVLIAGTTCATNFPLVQPLQGSFGGGVTDAFFARLGVAGNALLFSTYWGGPSTDEGGRIAVQADGRVYFSGIAASTNLPEIDPLQTGHRGVYDGFLVNLNASFDLTFMASYFGGTGSDTAAGIAVHGSNLYVAGHGNSSGLLGQSPAGLFDTFIARFEESNYSMTLHSTAAAISVGVSGAGCSPGTYAPGVVLAWTPGAICTVSFAGTQQAGDSRYVFKNWQDGSTANPRVFTAGPGLSSATLNFAAEHRLTLVVNPAAGGSVTATPASGESFYPAGSVVNLSAAAAPGYVFAGYSGSASTAQLTISAPASVAANFACTHSITPSWSGMQPSGGTVVSLAVNTGSGCSWSSSGAPAWLHLAIPSGAGSTNIVITVDANTSTSSRTAQFTIASTTVTVSQAGHVPPCAISTSIQSISAANSRVAATLRLTTTPAGCAWTASSTAAWIQVYPLAGSGDATLEYTIYPNFGSSVRSGSLTVGAKTIPVSQAQGIGSYNQRFAGLMYFNFFGRLASTGELALQAGVLDKGTSRADLVNSFFQTAEFNLGGRFIAGLYVGLLNRDAEFSGWLFQRNALSTGIVSPIQLVSNFLGAAEYKLAYGEPDDPGFVRLLYRYVLLREASQSEVNGQVNALRSGLTRVQLANNFLNSAEFRNGTGPRLTAFVLYACTLWRNPTTQERDTLVAELGAGIAPKQIVERLLGSAEFAEVLN
jgi:hypothetical protein